MQTDQWYLKKLVEDIPEEEMHAALHDEDLQHDEQRGEEGDESEDEEEGESEDEDYVQLSEAGSVTDEPSSEYSTCDGSEYSSSYSESGETTEGECRSESEDGEGTGCAVGEERAST